MKSSNISELVNRGTLLYLFGSRVMDGLWMACLMAALEKVDGMRERNGWRNGW